MTQTKHAACCLALLTALMAPAYASTITGPASQDAGTPFNVFGFSGPQNGDQLDGSTGTATYQLTIPLLGSASFNFDCTFVGNTCAGIIPPGVTLFGLNFFGSFSLTAPAGDTQDVWTIVNDGGFGLGFLRMTGFSVDVQPSNSAFNPCMSSGAPTVSTSSCSALTLGAATALSISSAAGGSAGITGTVEYSNAVSNSSGDLFGKIQLTFGGSNFITGRTFTFQADTDYVGIGGPEAITDVPEPTTLGLTAAGLAASAWLRRSKLRRGKKKPGIL
jgi:PEP-CTERM motif